MAEVQSKLHTQLNSLHTNIASMNDANTLLSDTIHNKIETLTSHIASLEVIINKKIGRSNNINIADQQI